MNHSMRLNPSPYEMVKSGRKTVELRLWDEKRRKLNVGDTITFVCTESGEALTATVLRLHLFSDFCELYKTLPLLRCGYTEDDINDASPSDMNEYYSPEEVHRYGVVGIEICRND